MTDEATNPVVDEEPILATEGVADEAHAQGDDQPQLDDDGNPIEGQAEDEETEEIERGDKKYRIPKALKDELLMHADYTRKTQEIAENRKALEARQAEIIQQGQAQAQTLEQRVQLATLDAQLSQYANLDWAEYARTYGSDNATVAMAQWQQLREARTGLEKDISEKEQEHRLSSERLSATALQEADQILSKEIKGYGPELVSKVAQAAQVYGFTTEELRDSFVGADGKADTRTFKALAELAELRAYKAEAEARKSKAQIAEKQASVQPAKTINAKANGYKAGLDDSLPTDEWLRRRNAAVAKANGR